MATSWNQFNDSSSISSASSGLEDALGKTSQKVVDPPSLEKIVSAPEHNSKININRQTKLAQNLQKLSKHKEDQVWLYVPQGDRKNKEISEILNNEDSILKVFEMKENKGWNVLVKTEKAANFLQKGLSKRGTFIFFVFSNRNENKKGKDYRSPQSKYLQKKTSIQDYVSPNSRKQFKSPKYRPKDSIKEKEQPEKKKTKYIAKVEEDKASERKIEEKIQEDKQQKIVKKFQTKEQNQNGGMKKSNSRSSQFKEKQKFEQKLQLSPDDDSDDEYERKNGKREKQEKKALESSQELKTLKKKEETKKNKKKNKEKKEKGGFQDSNNPFSSLTGV